MKEDGMDPLMQIETEDIPQVLRSRVPCDLRRGGTAEKASVVVQVRLRADMIGYAVCSDHVERAVTILKHETCWVCEMPADSCPCHSA